MKKIICYLLTMALMIGMVASVEVAPVKAKTIDPPPYSIYAAPTMKTVKLSWEKSNNVKKIIIYRADITKKYKKDRFVKLKKKSFKRIATLSGKTTKMTDKKVKKKRYYAYYFKAVLKKKWDGKKTYCDFDKKWYTKAYVGLEKPDLSCNGTDEYRTNDKVVYLSVDSEFGVLPKKYLVYRKGENDKKYKKIKVKYQPNDDEKPYFYADKNVEANKTYKYKVKAYLKKGKKKYYSKFSKAVKVKTVKPAEEKFEE